MKVYSIPKYTQGKFQNKRPVFDQINPAPRHKINVDVALYRLWFLARKEQLFYFHLDSEHKVSSLTLSNNFKANFLLKKGISTWSIPTPAHLSLGWKLLNRGVLQPTSLVDSSIFDIAHSFGQAHAKGFSKLKRKIMRFERFRLKKGWDIDDVADSTNEITALWSRFQASLIATKSNLTSALKKSDYSPQLFGSHSSSYLYLIPLIMFGRNTEALSKLLYFNFFKLGHYGVRKSIMYQLVDKLWNQPFPSPTNASEVGIATFEKFFSDQQDTLTDELLLLNIDPDDLDLEELKPIEAYSRYNPPLPYYSVIENLYSRAASFRSRRRIKKLAYYPSLSNFILSNSVSSVNANPPAILPAASVYPYPNQFRSKSKKRYGLKINITRKNIFFTFINNRTGAQRKTFSCGYVKGQTSRRGRTINTFLKLFLLCVNYLRSHNIRKLDLVTLTQNSVTAPNFAFENKSIQFYPKLFKDNHIAIRRWNYELRRPHGLQNRFPKLRRK